MRRAEEPASFGLPGPYYEYSARSSVSGHWAHIVTFRHDDPVEIPRDQASAVNSELALFFMGWVYGVTTDGGRSWSVWDAAEDLPGWTCCNYGLIEAVTLRADGSGTMRLHVSDRARAEVPELRTRDYGRNWTR